MTKYYTAFLYEGHQPKDRHVTHKYIGELDEVTARHLFLDLHFYFVIFPLELHLPKVEFFDEDFFGAKEGKLVRVLTTGEESPPLLPELRKLLGTYAKDEYPIYRPHIATDDAKKIFERFSSYALCTNAGTIIREWKNES